LTLVPLRTFFVDVPPVRCLDLDPISRAASAVRIRRIGALTNDAFEFQLVRATKQRDAQLVDMVYLFSTARDWRLQAKTAL
jgi:hypothetical protein